MRTSVVLFDAGGTLFTERLSRDEVYARELRALGVALPLEEVARLRAAVHDELPEVFAGCVRYSEGWFREFTRRLLARVGSAADPEAVRCRLAQHFLQAESYVVHADAPPALDALRAHGLRLAVVSNWSDRLPVLLEGLGLTPRFDAVVVSALVGASKPDPAIFAEALRRLDAPAAAALHVGDHPRNDYDGARSAGLAALLLDRTGVHARDAAPGDLIRSLAELPGRLTVG
ncbi:MAG TPA: HAD-IA family hydrolase [Planctomycetota bacterium]|nr:HAD-IA family hydrolase [Planctomycetota bacterium]